MTLVVFVPVLQLCFEKLNPFLTVCNSISTLDGNLCHTFLRLCYLTPQHLLIDAVFLHTAKEFPFL